MVGCLPPCGEPVTTGCRNGALGGRWDADRVIRSTHRNAVNRLRSLFTAGPRARPPPPPRGTMTPLTYRPSGAAKLLGISRATLYVLLNRGEIAYRKLGNATLIEHAELERYIASLPTTGGDR
jgi:excisionase family DNA binding protein